MRGAVVYRGPFESARLELLVSAMTRVFHDVDFVWLVPNSDLDAAAEKARFLEATGPGFNAIPLDGSKRALPASIRAVRGLVRDHDALMLIGIPPGAIGQSGQTRVWSINGIPEERLLHRGSIGTRMKVAATWWAYAAGRRPHLIVTVSAPMAGLAAARCRTARTIAVPCSVNRRTFRRDENAVRQHLVYLGTGAPWQGIRELAEHWHRLQQQNSELTFLAISRDPRTDLLGDGLRPGSFRRVGSDDKHQVNELLNTGRVGYLLREQNLVNEVAFPTKFGDYVACGLPVVVSDVGWDVTAMVNETGAGVVVPASPTFGDVASATNELLSRSPARVRAQCDAAAALVDFDHWRDTLAHAIEEIPKGCSS